MRIVAATRALDCPVIRSLNAAEHVPTKVEVETKLVTSCVFTNSSASVIEIDPNVLTFVNIGDEDSITMTNLGPTPVDSIAAVLDTPDSFEIAFDGCSLGSLGVLEDCIVTVKYTGGAALGILEFTYGSATVTGDKLVLLEVSP